MAGWLVAAGGLALFKAPKMLSKYGFQMLSKCGFKKFSMYGSLDFRTAKPSTKCCLVNAIPEQRYKIGMPYAMIMATENCRF